MPMQERMHEHAIPLWKSCTDACNYCHMLDCCRLSFREVCGQQYGGAGVRHGVHPVSAAAVVGLCLYTAGIAGPPDPIAGAAIGACHGGGVGDRGAGAHDVAECHLALSVVKPLGFGTDRPPRDTEEADLPGGNFRSARRPVGASYGGEAVAVQLVVACRN
jgi:hypothetical protein